MENSEDFLEKLAQIEDTTERQLAFKEYVAKMLEANASFFAAVRDYLKPLDFLVVWAIMCLSGPLSGLSL